MNNIFEKLSALTGGVHGSSYSDVATKLESLRKSAKPVSIKFDGDNTHYSTRIMAFNAQHKVFVIDNIFPPVPQGALTKGRTVTISSTDNDKTVSLEGKCLEPLVANARMGYEMRVSSALKTVEIDHDFEFGLGLPNREDSLRVMTHRKVVGL